jgi:hypothetical protein
MMQLRFGAEYNARRPDPITTSPRGGENDGKFFVPIAGSLQSAKAWLDTKSKTATRMALARTIFLLKNKTTDASK